ncbi:MAG: phosphate ABC transporter substrate-binding protein [Saprospiraceae bacterium]|nr:phosphate ABC transporter substrate-binding protein [Candidatus Vicinibacter affinis]
MKKIIVSLFALSLLFACNGGQKGSQESKSNNLSLKGSDTVLPLGQATAEQFMKTNPGVSISVVGGGSGTGVTALIDGNTDIAMCSRDLKGEEKLRLKEKGIDAVVKSVAVDALAVIVHKDNKVDQLTREQIEKIFTGEIKNWKEVGGEDAEIVVYSRENSSGTYEFFKEHVMDKKNYASTVLNMPATGAIVQSVSQTKGAISYVGLAYLNADTKALKVSYDQGATFTGPSMESAKDKTYPISRPLFYIYDSKSEAKVKAYLDFCLSAEGMKIVETVGYIPVQ